MATTYYTGGQSDREFGVGYARTSARTRDDRISVNHTIAVPFCDDPVVLIDVEITAAAAMTLTYVRMRTGMSSC